MLLYSGEIGDPCGTPTVVGFHLPLIGDFDRKALFDQPQHAPIHNTLFDQDDQLVVRNGRKVAAEINLYHTPSPLIQVITNRLGGHLRISLWAVTVGARMKVGLEDGFQHQLHRSLYYAVSNRRYP